MIKIIFGGDYCPSGRVTELIESGKFENVFGEIIPFLKSSNYSILNFECPVVIDKAEPILKHGPHLKSSKKALNSIKFAGFDMVTLANNHFYDFGDIGVKDTLSVCAEYGIDTVGGGKNKSESQRILYKKIENKQFAFINICEHEFSIATETNGGSNPLNPVANYYHIQEAYKNSDYVIVIVHGGHENYQLPSPRMKELYRFFVDAGADAVINHHQHCYSGYEEYNKKPIFYGLENLSFDWNGKRDSLWNEGFLLELFFEEDTISFKMHPYIQGNYNAGIVMMDDEKRSHFEENIRQLNTVISDDSQLNKSSNEFFLKDIKNLKALFEPYSNRYLLGLYRRNLLPTLISKKKLLAIKNFIECESHHDKLIYYLKKSINDER